MRCGNSKSHQEIQIGEIAKTNTPAEICVPVVFSVAHPLKIPKTCLTSSFQSRCYNSITGNDSYNNQIQTGRKLVKHDIQKIIICNNLVSVGGRRSQAISFLGRFIYFVSNKAQSGNLHWGRMVLYLLNPYQTLIWISSSWEQESHRKLL